MVFIETSLFTRQAIQFLSDDDYSGLQHAPSRDPEAGDLMRGTGGAECAALRKIVENWND